MKSLLSILGSILFAVGLASAQGGQFGNGAGSGVVPGASCGDATHASGWNGSAWFCQAITGAAAAGGSVNTLQWNNAGALGGITQWTTNGTTSLIGSSTAILNLGALPIANLTFPTAFATGALKVTTGTGALTVVTLPAGAIVGDTDTQTLTNKNLAGAGNTFPTFNQNTSGTAANLSGTPALPNGTTCTTQAAASNDTKCATDGYVDAHYIANGTSALGTSAISSPSCATVVTTAATGVATTDVITAGFNGDPTAVTGYAPSTSGMLTIIAYPTTNNVNFKVCNNTASSITPGAITLNWKVTR